MKVKAAAPAAPAPEATTKCALNDVEMDVMIADGGEKDAPMDYVRLLDSAQTEDSKLMTDNARGLAETLRHNL